MRTGLCMAICMQVTEQSVQNEGRPTPEFCMCLIQNKLSVRDQTQLLNQNCVQEEIKSRPKSENACYHSV